jgi:RimJ/RimL family protein N-acetyltransferase
LSWPTPRSLDDTRAFLAFSDSEWGRWPAGPYLIADRRDLTILGSTGLTFETPLRAATGYVLARDSWGKGYASEALRAMVELARTSGVRRLQAMCHIDHRLSWRVLEKCGFDREATLRRYCEFPNLQPVQPCDVFFYALVL